VFFNLGIFMSFKSIVQNLCLFLYLNGRRDSIVNDVTALTDLNNNNKNFF
jgi:hypothetical protein